MTGKQSHEVPNPVDNMAALAENNIMRFLVGVKKLSRQLVTSISFLLIAGVGVLDYLTGYELSFFVFYILPISMLAWKGRWLGLLGSAASAAVWTFANVEAGLTYSSTFVLCWNIIVRLLTFVILTLLISVLAESNARLERVSRIDPLTGAANSRAFLELLNSEIERTRRYRRSFTLCYLDLDNFKSINDIFGHAVGDDVLRTFVSIVRGQIRSSDVIVRLGGDEFALLLPEADESAAHVVIDKIHAATKSSMNAKGWHVTISAGSLTCLDSRRGAEELIKMADDLMYQAKAQGKDGATFSTLSA
jgi:diguanylate cyclase (GGDEF)-like protein